jgi:hypothetical protein
MKQQSSDINSAANMDPSMFSDISNGLNLIGSVGGKAAGM